MEASLDLQTALEETNNNDDNSDGSDIIFWSDEEEVCGNTDERMDDSSASSCYSVFPLDGPMKLDKPMCEKCGEESKFYDIGRIYISSLSKWNNVIEGMEEVQGWSHAYKAFDAHLIMVINNILRKKKLYHCLNEDYIWYLIHDHDFCRLPVDMVTGDLLKIGLVKVDIKEENDQKINQERYHWTPRLMQTLVKFYRNTYLGMKASHGNKFLLQLGSQRKTSKMALEEQVPKCIDFDGTEENELDIECRTNKCLFYELCVSEFRAIFENGKNHIFPWEKRSYYIPMDYQGKWILLIITMTSNGVTDYCQIVDPRKTKWDNIPETLKKYVVGIAAHIHLLEKEMGVNQGLDYQKMWALNERKHLIQGPTIKKQSYKINMLKYSDVQPFPNYEDGHLIIGMIFCYLTGTEPLNMENYFEKLKSRGVGYIIKLLFVDILNGYVNRHNLIGFEE